MRRISLLLSLVMLMALLTPSVKALPVSSDGLSITSASIQVQSVSDPSTWTTTTNVYEGSPARLELVVETSRPGTVRTVVTVPGVSDSVGDTSSNVSPGSSSLTVPLDLSYGAWLAGSTPNTADQLDITVTFTPTSPASPAQGGSIEDPQRSETSPTPVPSAFDAPSQEPTVAESRPASVRITGTRPKDRQALRQVMRSLPPGVGVVAVILPSKSRAADCPTRRQLVRMVTSLAKSTDRSLRIQGRTAVGRQCARMIVTVANEPTARSATLSTSVEVEVAITLSPRPLILVHGMWSSADTWIAYTRTGNFLIGRHPRWRGYAVSTMDTGSPLLPYRDVKTVAENAQLAWTYIQARMSELNAHEVDIAAHSLGGVITRRMLHDAANGAAAQSAVRSVVLLGTPNGGSTCSDAWPVPANRELTHSAMDAFNRAYPGYPQTFTTSLYSDHFTSTCFDANAGDLFVPSWSTQAQSVNVVQRINPGVQHANMPGDSRLFTDYIVPTLALPDSPPNAGPTARLTNPNALSTELAKGEATGGSLSVIQSVTVEPGQTLVASVIADSGASGTVTYPAGAGTASVPLTRIGDYPLFEAEVTYATLGGTAGAQTVSVSIAATTTAASPQWRWSLTVRR